MNPIEFTRLVNSLSRRREDDAEVWALIAKVLVTLMNTKKMRVEDLMQVTTFMSNAKVRSNKLYKFIARYLMAVGFDESTQAKI